MEEKEERLPATRTIEPAGELGPPVGKLTKEIVAQAVVQASLLKDLRLGMLKSTTSAQWHDMDGKPYLKDGGIMAVAGAIGLRFGAPDTKREDGKDSKGSFTVFRTDLSAEWLGQSFYDRGISSTRDPFFARKHQTDVPYEEIDLGDVEKKSITNARHRILVRALAIDGFTWEELFEVAGIKRPAQSTRYKGAEQRKTTGGGAWTPGKDQLQGMLLEMAGGDVEGAAERLLGFTANPDKGYRGYRDPAAVPEAVMKWLLPRVEKEYSLWVDRQAVEEQEAPKAPAASPAPSREPGQEG